MSKSFSANKQRLWEKELFPKACYHNRLAKKLGRSGDLVGKGEHYRKKIAIIREAAYRGIEFDLATDNLSLFSFGFGDKKRLHLTRKPRLGFATFEQEYQVVMDLLCGSIEKARQTKVSYADFGRIRRVISILPKGDLNPVRSALKRARSALDRGHHGAVTYELCRARGKFRRVLKSIFPVTATLLQQELISDSIVAATTCCLRRSFELEIFESIWDAICLCSLTSSRILRDLWWLQDASLGAREREDFGYAIKKLALIHRDLCPNVALVNFQDGDTNEGVIRTSHPKNPAGSSSKSVR